MTYVKFDPIRSFETLAKTFGQMAGEAEKEIFSHEFAYKPRVDIIEFEGVYTVNIELPGLSKEEISISVSDDKTLVVKGEKKKSVVEGKRYIRSERVYGQFKRSFELPNDADMEKISAKFEKGMLELTIPSVKPIEKKEIEIQIQ